MADFLFVIVERFSLALTVVVFVVFAMRSIRALVLWTEVTKWYGHSEGEMI